MYEYRNGETAWWVVVELKRKEGEFMWVSFITCGNWRLPWAQVWVLWFYHCLPQQHRKSYQGSEHDVDGWGVCMCVYSCTCVGVCVWVHVCRWWLVSILGWMLEQPLSPCFDTYANEGASPMKIPRSASHGPHHVDWAQENWLKC